MIKRKQRKPFHKQEISITRTGINKTQSSHYPNATPEDMRVRKGERQTDGEVRG